MGVLIISLVALFITTTGLAAPFLVKALNSRKRNQTEKTRSPTILEFDSQGQDIMVFSVPETELIPKPEREAPNGAKVDQRARSPSISPPVREFDVPRARVASASSSSSQSVTSLENDSSSSVATSCFSRQSTFDSDQVKSAASQASAATAKSKSDGCRAAHTSEEEEQQVRKADSDQLTADIEEEGVPVQRENPAEQCVDTTRGKKTAGTPIMEARNNSSTNVLVGDPCKLLNGKPEGGNEEAGGSSGSSDSDCEYCQKERLSKAEAAVAAADPSPPLK